MLTSILIYQTASNTVMGRDSKNHAPTLDIESNVKIFFPTFEVYFISPTH